jgi:hypothetical protein
LLHNIQIHEDSIVRIYISYRIKNTSTCTLSAPVGHELNFFAL